MSPVDWLLVCTGLALRSKLKTHPSASLRCQRPGAGVVGVADVGVGHLLTGLGGKKA